MFDLAAARRVRLLGMDVDGVQTDNAIYLGDINGTAVEFKQFDIQDGLGYALLRGTGIEVAWISGRVSEATSHRAAQLGITEVLQVPAGDKVTAIETLLTERGIEWDAFAFVGDDLADLPVLERAGLAIAVANARPEILQVTPHVTEARGGHGAVREVIERLLQSRGEYEAALARYLGREAVAS